jgi:methyl-accepting chemotaxis protein
VSTFHTLGVLTRIETARLGGQGSDFGHLADDMQVLAGNVREKVEGALETAAVLTPLIDSAIKEISALEEGQAKDLPSVISGVSASLSSFREIQDAALNSSVRLGARYAAISGAFKELIVSVQFHDITRQQIEHVIEALRRICPESNGEVGGASCDRSGISSVLIIQSSQLADAGEKFAASAETVAETLDESATNILEMAEESSKLSGLSEDKTNSFFLEMEQGCSAILASLGHCATVEAATQVSGSGLAETIRQMLACVEEIRSIEAQMKRMALNAIIRAAQIGAPGAALGVVADSLRQGAYESGKRTKSLFESLHAMSEAATQLCGNGGSEPGSERGSQDDCLEEMRASVGELHSSNERSFAQIAQIVDHGNRLREDLSATRQHFTVGTLFADAISHTRGMLRRFEEKNQSGLPGEEMAALELGLADHATRYTMQSERDVHELVTKALVGAAPADVLLQRPKSTSVRADELGENVEFF